MIRLKLLRRRLNYGKRIKKSKMSLLNKRWQIICEDKSLDLKTKLLKNRGILSEEAIDKFFSDDYVFYDPYLLKDMDIAVDRLKKAIENDEKIVVFGDYDVDGISGSALLILTLRELNAKVSYRLPNRFKDGYGLQNHFVEELAKLGVKLIITVDNGIACKEQIDLAASLGIDVIVTDHHTIPENFPHNAYAVIHPKQEGCDYPFKDLSGSGVAFKLAKALLRIYNDEKFEKFIDDLFDLASLGTVADCTSLTSENRFIVKRGLEKLHESRWRGLSLLRKHVGIPDVLPRQPKAMIHNSDYIGFHIGPRINAAGRIADPYFALQALIDEGGKAEILVQELEQLNRRRQVITTKALQDLELIYKDSLKNDSICIAHHSEWISGIVGLIAGKISEKYGKPAFVMEDRGDVLIGSARCPDFFNVFEAIKFSSEFLDHFGGHKQAAGFSLKKENLANFTNSLKNYSESLAGQDMRSVMNIDAEIFHNDINFDTISLLESFAPFGVGNPKPNFVLKRIKPLNLRTIGKESKHLAFDCQLADSSIFRAVAFNFGAFAREIANKEKIDIVFNLEKNVWNDYTNLQLNVLDFEIC